MANYFRLDYGEKKQTSIVYKRFELDVQDKLKKDSKASEKL